VLQHSGGSHFKEAPNPSPCLVAKNGKQKATINWGQLQQQKGKMASLCCPFAAWQLVGAVGVLQQPLLEKFPGHAFLLPRTSMGSQLTRGSCSR